MLVHTITYLFQCYWWFSAKLTTYTFHPSSLPISLLFWILISKITNSKYIKFHWADLNPSKYAENIRKSTNFWFDFIKNFASMCNLLQYSKFNYFVFATCVLWVIIIKTIFNMPRYNTYSMMWKKSFRHRRYFSCRELPQGYYYCKYSES